MLESAAYALPGLNNGRARLFSITPIPGTTSHLLLNYMIANHDSTCDECGEPIYAGDAVTVSNAAQYTAHKRCTEKPVPIEYPEQPETVKDAEVYFAGLAKAASHSRSAMRALSVSAGLSVAFLHSLAKKHPDAEPEYETPKPLRLRAALFASHYVNSLPIEDVRGIAAVECLRSQGSETDQEFRDSIAACIAAGDFTPIG